MKINITKNQDEEVFNGENPCRLRFILLPMCSPTPKSSFVVKKSSSNLKKHFLALNMSNYIFLFAILGLHTRMGLGHTCMGINTRFFRSDTSMSKLKRVWADNSEFALGVFMKVVAFDVTFHLSLVPRYFELRCSKYDQNITRIS